MPGRWLGESGGGRPGAAARRRLRSESRVTALHPVAAPGPPQLELRGICKAFGAVVANDGIDMVVQPGEIHAVLGENGAGKSTLMKIVYGVTAPSAGEMRWAGAPVSVASPRQARALGIGMVFQHFALFETLTVVQNVALALPGSPDLGDLARRIDAVSRRYGLPVDPRRLVHALSVGERQRVEIIRCLLQNPRLLIMDEPTSVLTPQAVRKLFETLRQLAAEGCSILYISHKLDEIQELCDSATVLRNGRVSGHCRPRDETAASMARLMIGRDLPHCRHAAPADGGPARLELRGLSLASREPFGTDLNGIDLEVRAGEIVGIAGVSGNGQQELLAALSGERTFDPADAVRLCGVAAGRLGAAARRRLGLGFVPEERLGRGAVPAMSLADNALLTAHGRGLVRHGLLRRAAMHAFARRCIADFNVKCSGSEALAQSLSGGNLQKFIVGREIVQEPRVLVVAQPTWGVDVGAAAFIRQALIDLRDRGTAVLVVSEELDELFEICDRLAVIAAGRLSPALPVRQLNVEKVGAWMSGLWADDAGAVAEEQMHVA
ncbi:MAG: ABC transporter ATP-binding protein [Burkholderiales bacterium]|nr:ABC transporter ATP-binding protein [Burkholderiales bacterium]MDE2455280.1 ABC transporter ATP-binding protein [Burkholderiales bacterium]